ncbi:small subunit ribosomal protein S4 [Desulfosalsimonas propionicica]|uniref:Small ribosomal subunit protein uS4 n=1 Tax=Desulfosalsimonas propionicica TaxID=332175 RepID=A0A7W0CA29_9BACT|nr:small subunit ribosomal protein S4 [Desulfosalsimonas propionicica]
MKLYFKGDRCYSDKCAFDRRSYPPGQHGQRRGGKISDYGLQLREKQKVKRAYGLSEKQFRLFFERSEQKKGVTGTNLLVMLECRLDNVVYRLGFASSRVQGRQLVKHSHFLINGRKVNIPSYQVKPGDVVEIREKSRNVAAINEAIESMVRRGMPQWLELDKEALKGSVKTLPVRDDITMPIQENQIIEFYSK